MIRLWRAVTVLWMAALLTAAVLPSTLGGPSGVVWHLVGFGVLVVLFGQWLSLPAAALLAWGYGVLIEGIQWLLPYRTGDIADVAVNAAGVAAGIIVTRLATRFRLLRG